MDAQWLHMQFEQHPDKSKSGLAKALDLEPSAISKILTNHRQIKAQEYVIMRSYFGLPNDGEKSIKPHNPEKHSNQNSLQEPEDRKSQNSAWKIPGSKTQNAHEEGIQIYKIRENVMAPEFKIGDHVAIDMTDTTPSPPGIFMISDGYGAFIRRCEIEPGTEPAQVILKTNDSRENKNLEDLEIIGRVVGKIEWL